MLDWDGDGLQDLVFDLGSCFAWRKGDGTFQLGGHTCIGPVGALAAVVTDAGGDALLVAQSDGWWLRRADARGLLGAGVQVASAELAASLDRDFAAPADVDADGHPEIYAWTSTVPPALVRFDAVDGAWRGCRLYAGPRDLYSIPAGDLDGDKKLDLLAWRTCSQCTSNHIVARGR